MVSYMPHASFTTSVVPVVEGYDPVALTSALVAFPSITPHDHGVQAYIATQLEALGFTCQPIPLGPPDAQVANLHAYWAGQRADAPRLAFAGHTDVVPPGEANLWRFPPFTPTCHDGLSYGRGVVDMKGAIAAFIAAIASYRAQYGMPAGGLSLLITGDEEGDATYGTAPLLQRLQAAGYAWDGCIVGEPTNPNHVGEMLKIGRRGSLQCTLTVHGTQGHVAYPDQADNPISVLLRILHRLETTPLDTGMPYFDPSRAVITSVDVGNPVRNVIPASACAQWNIRFNPHHTADSLEALIRSWCDAAWPEGVSPSYTLVCRATAEAFRNPPGKLAEIMVEATKVTTGRTPVYSTSGGTSDARFIHHYCPVVECGLVNHTAHHVDECIAISELYCLHAVYYEALRLWYGAPAGAQ
jgi:succinyl-diaminopimelate desuccinylase